MKLPLTTLGALITLSLPLAAQAGMMKSQELRRELARRSPPAPGTTTGSSSQSPPLQLVVSKEQIQAAAKRGDTALVQKYMDQLAKQSQELFNKLTPAQRESTLAQFAEQAPKNAPNAEIHKEYTEKHREKLEAEKAGQGKKK